MKTFKRVGLHGCWVVIAIFFSFALVPTNANGQFAVFDVPHTVITSAIKYLQGASFGDLVEGVKKLEQISKVVRQAGRGIEIAKKSATVIGKVNTISTTLASDAHILDFEYKGISRRFEVMADEVELAVKDLSNVVQTNGTTMDDAGRLDLLNQAYERISKVDNELSGIFSYYQMVSRKRARNQADRASTARLYASAGRTINTINTKVAKDFSKMLDDAFADDKFQNVDLEKEKGIRLAIAEDVSKETARVNNYVQGLEKLKRSEFAVGAAVAYPKRTDSRCRAMEDLAKTLSEVIGEGVEESPDYQALLARAESCHIEVDNYNDQQEALRQKYIDDQMVSGNFSQTYSDMRRDMMYDAMKAIFAKYGKTYNVPK
ncbi:hypothetical protein LV89_04752 [Arcicella aurantiaca]|uniref:Uncharacterized protein n=1 Tax=Arcicella aurantiaca TaxID=591202 RepID=A0A316DFF9_9BACT|nr:hypothetical protein [Arcicella aurantiaca]PWK16794.1 hypothetical protein LV89_04752 [Arcicella aurantiaca]